MAQKGIPEWLQGWWARRMIHRHLPIGSFPGHFQNHWCFWRLERRQLWCWWSLHFWNADSSGQKWCLPLFIFLWVSVRWRRFRPLIRRMSTAIIWEAMRFPEDIWRRKATEETTYSHMEGRLTVVWFRNFPPRIMYHYGISERMQISVSTGKKHSFTDLEIQPCMHLLRIFPRQ